MLAYERHGTGEPLVLIHGIGHRRQAWYPVLEFLTPYREVVLLDLPGHGESSPLELNGRTAVEAIRDDLREFLVQQNLERPHLAGNSLGGLVALDAAAAGFARSVTGLSPAGFWRSSAEFAYTYRLFQVVSSAAKRVAPRAEQMARTASGRCFLFGWLVAHPSRLPIDQAMGDLKGFLAAQPAMKQILQSQAGQIRAAVPDVPVTIGWSTVDFVLPPIQAWQAKKLLPHATHEWLRSCGHAPMSDDPQRVADLLLRGSSSV